MLAQFFVTSLTELLEGLGHDDENDENETAGSARSGEETILSGCVRFMLKNKKCALMHHKVRSLYRKYDPEASASLECLLATSTDDALGEKCEKPLTRMVQSAFAECVDIFRAAERKKTREA